MAQLNEAKYVPHMHALNLPPFLSDDVKGLVSHDLN